MTPDYKERLAAEVGRNPLPALGYERYSGVYFFLSLDLVNSTAYKADHSNWKFLARMFYDDARKFWSNHDVNFTPRVWKYAGDEVLFYAPVRSVLGLQTAVEASYHAVRSVSKTVQSWTAKGRTRLYVKGTCWAAYASYTGPSSDKDLPREDTADSKQRNLIFPIAPGPPESVPILDFLGPEIDAGFRISAGSMKNSLVVSAEVANAIRREGRRELGNRLRIVEFRELKGVWSGRHYPLVWYREDWSENAFGEDFEYDDRFRSQLLDAAYRAQDDSADQLESILQSVGRTWLFEALPATSSETESDPDIATIRIPELQVHCVAVCFSEFGRVLIAKRKASKSVYPGCWETGCAQLRPGEDFYSAMKRDYLADFGIQLDFSSVTDDGPIANYRFEKDGRTVPGIIFVAQVKGEPLLSRSKHEDVRWIEPKELSSLVGDRTVPDLISHVHRAYEQWLACAGGPAHSPVLPP